MSIWLPHGVGPHPDAKNNERTARRVIAVQPFSPHVLRGEKWSVPCEVAMIDGRWQVVRVDKKNARPTQRAQATIYKEAV